MKQEKLMAVYLCPKCDRTYYSVDRGTWDLNRQKHNAIARSVKSNHKCPWERKGKGSKGNANS